MGPVPPMAPLPPDPGTPAALSGKPGEASIDPPAPPSAASGNERSTGSPARLPQANAQHITPSRPRTATGYRDEPATIGHSSLTRILLQSPARRRSASRINLSQPLGARQTS